MSHKRSLKFNPSPPYRLDATRFVTGLFEGVGFSLGGGGEIITNLPPGEGLYDLSLLPNLNGVRERSRVEQRLSLEVDLGPVLPAYDH